VKVRLTLAALALLALPRPTPADPPPAPERLWRDALWLGPVLAQAGDKASRPESVRMLSAVLRGSQMGPGDGWFGPGRSRYTWDWLRARFKAGPDGITRKQFGGPAELFDRLDRDRDGTLTAEDFDWSDKSPFLRQTAMFRQWFSMMDGDSNGRVSRKEWQAFFDRLAKGKDHITPDELRLALQPPAPPKAAGKGKKGGPSRELLVKNLIKGDLGSPYEGPRPGEPAPDFTLPTHDGTAKVTLSDFRDRKPVVLIFGNFT
jgi:AhpC/TSA family/EF hand